MSSKATGRARGIARAFRRRAGRFAGHQDGASTVEFALVVTPFLALMFAIMETAIIFFAGQALETATADSARLIMTGQAQSQGFDQAKFKQEVCARIKGLFDCSGGISIDVRSYKAFSSVQTGKPLDQNGELDKNLAFDPGKAGDIVVVRVMYPWPVWVSLLGLNLADMAGNKRLLLATAAFRNEPF